MSQKVKEKHEKSHTFCAIIFIKNSMPLTLPQLTQWDS